MSSDMEMERIDAREARRRRIVERGSDRLALIKGRIDSLPPAPPPSPSGTPHVHHAPAEFPSRFSKDNHIFASDHQNNDTPRDENDAYSASSLEYDADAKCSEGQRCKPEIHSEFSESAAENFVDDGRNIEVHAGTSIVQQAQRQLPQKMHVVNMFSSKQINFCIIASETTRALCALLIALLAVLSYVDNYLVGRNIVSSESIIAYKPLYILLLTDVTIVLCRLYIEKGRALEDAYDPTMAFQRSVPNWDGAVKVLERGLAAYQAIRGVFIDCSIYIVVVTFVSLL